MDFNRLSLSMIPYNRHLKKISRRLRSNMTDAERRLWSRIRRKNIEGVQFYRQKIVGNYIVDFYSFAAKLVVEVDGSQHLEERQKRKDQIRDQYLRELGFQVLRFSSREVLTNTENVVQAIQDVVKGHANPPVPL